MQAGLYSAGKGASNNSFPRRQVSVTILCYLATAGCMGRIAAHCPNCHGAVGVGRAKDRI
jgi:hypothetical protein